MKKPTMTATKINERKLAIIERCAIQHLLCYASTII